MATGRYLVKVLMIAIGITLFLTMPISWKGTCHMPERQKKKKPPPNPPPPPPPPPSPYGW